MGVAMVRRYGWTLLLGRDDSGCPLGSTAMGFDPPREQFRDGTLFAEYTGRPQEAVPAEA
jgi:uncharacterized protein (DUF169 family)